MKRLLSILLCITMASSILVGCGAKTETVDTETTGAAGTGTTETEAAKTDVQTENAAKEEKSADQKNTSSGSKKIGISVLTMAGQFFVDLVDSAQKTLEAQGGELVVNDADNSSKKQVAALENFI